MNSPNQVQERLVWFWVNHFSIAQGKANLRLFAGDYEATLRAHALGKFRDLLEASAMHPAMLRYLDNERNAAGQINENYARELMELHTLGVDGGYSQADVQEMARVLTGLGVRVDADDAKVKPQLQAQYVHVGALEFNPNRHDQEPKVVLGQHVQPAGIAEVHLILDRLARNPATARHVSAQLAQYFVADVPPPALVDRMAQPLAGHRRRHRRGDEDAARRRPSTTRRSARASRIRSPTWCRPRAWPTTATSSSIPSRCSTRCASWARRRSGARRPTAGRWSRPHGPAPAR